VKYLCGGYFEVWCGGIYFFCFGFLLFVGDCGNCGMLWVLCFEGVFSGFVYCDSRGGGGVVGWDLWVLGCWGGVGGRFVFFGGIGQSRKDRHRFGQKEIPKTRPRSKGSVIRLVKRRTEKSHFRVFWTVKEAASLGRSRIVFETEGKEGEKEREKTSHTCFPGKNSPKKKSEKKTWNNEKSGKRREKKNG